MSFEICNHAVVKIVSFYLLLSNEWFGFKIKVTSVHSDQGLVFLFGFPP